MERILLKEDSYHLLKEDGFALLIDYTPQRRPGAISPAERFTLGESQTGYSLGESKKDYDLGISQHTYNLGD